MAAARRIDIGRARALPSSSFLNAQRLRAHAFRRPRGVSLAFSPLRPFRLSSSRRAYARALYDSRQTWSRAGRRRPCAISGGERARRATLPPPGAPLLPSACRPARARRLLLAGAFQPTPGRPGRAPSSRRAQTFLDGDRLRAGARAALRGAKMRGVRKKRRHIEALGSGFALRKCHALRAL